MLGTLPRRPRDTFRYAGRRLGRCVRQTPSKVFDHLVDLGTLMALAGCPEEALAVWEAAYGAGVARPTEQRSAWDGCAEQAVCHVVGRGVPNGPDGALETVEAWDRRVRADLVRNSLVLSLQGPFDPTRWPDLCRAAEARADESLHAPSAEEAATLAAALASAELPPYARQDLRLLRADLVARRGDEALAIETLEAWCADGRRGSNAAAAQLLGLRPLSRLACAGALRGALEVTAADCREAVPVVLSELAKARDRS